MKKLIIAFLACFLFYESRAQENSENNPASITDISASESAQNGYSVDPFTGVASIHIPIYNYAIDGLDLSVSLGYSTKGIKVDQVASAVGLGWDLNASGFIERQTIGIEDEITIPAAGDMSENYRGRWATNTNASSFIDGCDVYTAVFGGRAIKFMINTTSSNGWTIIDLSTSPRSEIKIEVIDGNGNPKTSLFSTSFGTSMSDKYTFRITDEKGNVFEFDRGDYGGKNFFYKSAPNHAPYTYYTTKKWNLKKVTTFSGGEINYTYISNNISYPLYEYQAMIETISSSSVVTYAGVEIDVKNYSGYYSQISSIEYPNGIKVLFNMGYPRCDIPGLSELANIKIESKYNTDWKNSITFKLHHAYFSTPVNVSGFNSSEVAFGIGTVTCNSYYTLLQNAGWTANQINDYFNRGLRLKLTKITKFGSDDEFSSEPYYSFEYQSETDNNKALPYRLSPKQDYLGYHNNQTPTNFIHPTGTYSLSIPFHTVNIEYPVTGSSIPQDFGIDKSFDFSYAQAWTLKKMKNALGGTTEFFYKTHSLSNPPNTTVPTDYDVDNILDGLCIDKVTYTDGISSQNTHTTLYTYSNGYRFQPGGYFWEPEEYTGGDPRTPSSSAYVSKRKYQNHLITPLVTIRGANHGYSNVTIQKIGYLNEVLSSTEYTFSNIVNPSTNACYYDFSGKSWQHTMSNGLWAIEHKVGNLLEVKSYLGSHTAMNQKVVFEYQEDNTTGHSEGSTAENRFYKYDNIYYISAYANRTAISKNKMRLYKKYVTNYSGNETKLTEHTYQYDSYDNLIATFWNDNNGTNNKRQYKYNYNYTNLLTGKQHLLTTRDYIYAGSGYSLSCQMLRPMVSGSKILPQSYFTYVSDKPAYLTGNASTDYFDDEACMTSNASTPYFKKIIQNTQFDDKNNVLECKINDLNDSYTSAIWDTRIGQKVAEVSNAKYEDIAFTSFEGFTTSTVVNTYDKGNWLFDVGKVILGSNTTLGKAITGKYCYHLDQNYVYRYLSENKKYYISFWADNLPEVKLNGYVIPLTAENPIDGWRLYHGYFTTGTVTPVVTIAATTYNPNSGYIDELRLHPAEASMTSYTYEPLFGAMSINNERNVITYLQYDKLGRPLILRDMYGNILSKTKLVKQGSDN